MARDYINPPDIAAPPSGLYNHVVKVGNTVYTAGQVSRGLDGSTLHVGDVAGQVRQVWANLEKALKAAGGSIEDIVKTTTYVVGAENVGEVVRARQDTLPSERRPASTMVVVAALANPELLVEIEAIAVIGDD